MRRNTGHRVEPIWGMALRIGTMNAANADMLMHELMAERPTTDELQETERMYVHTVERACMIRLRLQDHTVRETAAIPILARYEMEIDRLGRLLGVINAVWAAGGHR